MVLERFVGNEEAAGSNPVTLTMDLQQKLVEQLKALAEKLNGLGGPRAIYNFLVRESGFSNNDRHSARKCPLVQYVKDSVDAKADEVFYSSGNITLWIKANPHVKPKVDELYAGLDFSGYEHIMEFVVWNQHYLMDGK